MADAIDFPPLITRTIDDIRAQFDADANAGVDPSDDAWVDVNVGGWFYDVTQVVGLEIERLWDFLGTEVPAAALLLFSFGTYLDAWGDALSVPRKDATASLGVAHFTGTDGTFVSTGVQVGMPPATPDDDPIIFATTASGIIAAGVLDLPIAAVDEGSGGNVAALAITQIFSPVDAGVTGVSNVARTTSGTDVEIDSAYKGRLLLEFQGGTGAGNIADYQRMGLAEPGVGYVTVEPVWSGPGTVRMIVTDPSNDPVAGPIITSLQTRIDPVSGQGRGEAPIGATVTIATPTGLAVTIAGTVVPEDGYTLDGTGGTSALRGPLTTVLGQYVDGLAPGADVKLHKVQSLFFDVIGVAEYSGVTINGVAADLVIGALQVAQFQPPTLS